MRRAVVAGVLAQAPLSYVERALGAPTARAVLATAGWGEDVSRFRWYDWDDVVALYASAAEITGDPGIGRRAGEELFRLSCENGGMVEAAGSGPAGTLAWAAAANARLTDGRQIEVTESGEHHAVLVARYHPPANPARVICDLAAGCWASIPSLFGLVGTAVETRCQALGHDECRYVVRWGPAPGAAELGTTAPTALRDRRALALRRLEDLQAMAADLAGVTDVDAALAQACDRVWVAVQAPRFVVAVTPDPERPPLVHHVGFTDDAEAREVAARLLAGEPPGDRVPHVAAPVRSGSRHWGVLAALWQPDARPTAVDRRFVSAYASHVAAVLDTVSALDAARVERDAATALLDLAQGLAGATSEEEVATCVAMSLPTVCGADHGEVWLEDPHGGGPVLAAAHGDGTAPASDLWDPDAAAAGEAAEATVAQVTAPIEARGEVLGAVTAGFRRRLTSVEEQAAVDRLLGLAAHAATALGISRLLGELRHRALHDPLTRLPNRVLVEDRAERAFAAASRTGAGVGLVFLDLDRLKHVNDTLGHPLGDELIAAVATRLATAVRAADTLARFGGDEFVVLLPDCPSPHDAEAGAQRALGALRRPFRVDDHDLYVTASAGVAWSPRDGDDFHALLSRADAAMYVAKEGGGDRWASPPAGGSRERRLRLESELHRALERDELVVRYQPQVHLSTLQVVGVEALVRWRHPTAGLLEPAAFLGVAEETGLVVELDRRVRRIALDALAAWRRAGAGEVRLALNLSQRELHDPALPERIAREVAAAGVPPGAVELEVTDRVVMDEDDLPVLLARLRALGLRLAIDDFGTGTSVLSRLHRCPVDTLKIDRSFVADLAEPGADAPVVGALVAMSRQLGLDIVAEGAESAAQVQTLHALGCEVVQGRWFHAPTDEETVARLLTGGRGWRPSPRTSPHPRP